METIANYFTKTLKCRIGDDMMMKYKILAVLLFSSVLTHAQTEELPTGAGPSLTLAKR